MKREPWTETDIRLPRDEMVMTGAGWLTVRGRIDAPMAARGMPARDTPAHITNLLVAWARGEESALDERTPLVHGELRRLTWSYLRREAAAGLIAAVVVLVPQSAEAQPWVPPAGTGALTVGVQRIDHTGHRVTDGTLFSNGTSLNVSLFIGVDYALTNRWIVSAALPYVFGKYTDPGPPPPFVPFLPIDQCRCWNSDVQDLEVTARYNIANGAFALTPAVSVVVPSGNYAYRGESVVGRQLRELRMGIDAGQRLDAIHPRLSVDGRYMLAIVERVLDIPNNRSNAAVGVAYRIRSNLSARGIIGWQRTHGGLRIGAPPPSELLPPGEVNTPERLDQHDRLLRDNSTHIGVAASYQFPRVDLFASYVAFVGGSDTHAGRAVTAGISWPFHFGP